MKRNGIFRVPGTVWVALIMAVIVWLQDSFPNELWLAGIVGALTFISGLIQVYWPKPEPSPVQEVYAQARLSEPESNGHKFLRVLFGG